MAMNICDPLPEYTYSQPRENYCDSLTYLPKALLDITY